jgi:WD40 repeat protein/serine/threonine protein kinase/tetratricopeptide (TPR) repeat protein
MTDRVAPTDSALEGLLGQVAGEFTERLNRGEQPDVEEYARRHPEIAEVLRQVLPALYAMGPGQPEASSSSVALEGVAPGYLGDFRILREIGRGGMGFVYEAEQVSLGRRVALKVLPFAATLDAKQLQRFKNEAQAAAHLHHTNIVPVFAVGCERGVHYYAMQLIDGQSLAAVIRDLRRQAGLDGVEHATAGESSASGPGDPQRTTAYPAAVPAVPAGETSTLVAQALATERSTQRPAFFRTVARLGVQAAKALEHAHQMGVVHRDVKPANLLVDGRGNLWITDFGLAQFQSDTKLTLTGDLVGTLRYMSPEQALGGRSVLDHRTDVYSLGVTLYELLTLEPAFAGTDRQELLQQVAFAEPRAPRRISKTIPAELEIIVLKALAKAPDERYATAQELADDLERFLKDEPIRAKRPSLVQRARKWTRRHRAVVATLAAAAVVTLLAVTVVATVAYFQVDAARDEATNRARDAEEAQGKEAEQRQLADKSAWEARRILVGLQVSSGVRLMDKGDLLGALLWFTQALKNEQDSQAEKMHRLRLAAVLTHCPKLVQVWFHDNELASFSPDGRYVFIAKRDGTARVWDVFTREPVSPPLPQEGQVYRAVFGPDGRHVVSFTRRLAVSPDGRRADTPSHEGHVWEVATGRRVAPPLKHNGTVLAAAFSPEGSRIVTGTGHEPIAGAFIHTARVWDAATGNAVTPPLKHDFTVEHVAFTTDGRRIITGRNPQQLWDAATGNPISPLPVPLDLAERRVLSPDGGYLFSWKGSGKNSARLLDVATGTVLTPPLQVPGAILQAVFSPGRDRLLTVVAPDDSERREIWIWDVPKGELASSSIRLETYVKSLGFSPDGRRIFTLGDRWPGQAQVWDAGTGQPLTPPLYHGHGDEPSRATFTADGSYLLMTGGSTTRVWDVAAGRPAALVLSHAGVLLPVMNPAFSPDNGRVVTASAGAVRVWDTTTGAPVTPPLKHSSSVVTGAYFSPDGRRVLTLSWPRWPSRPPQGKMPEGEVRVWDAATGQRLTPPLGHFLFGGAGSRWRDPPSFNSPTPASVLYWVTIDGERLADPPAFSPDSTLVLTVSNGAACVWDAGTGRAMTPPLKEGKDSVARAAFSADSRQVITVSVAGELQAWDVATGRLLSPPAKPNRRFVAVSPDGRHGLTVDGLTVQVRDVATGLPVTPPLSHLDSHGVNHATFSPDGRRVLTVNLSGARVWDARTGEPIGLPVKPRTGWVRPPTFSPDSLLLLMVNPGEGERVWDATTGLPVTPPLKQPGEGGAFSPDGRRVVIAGRFDARLWELLADERPVEDLVLLAEFLTGQRLDPTGTGVRLEVSPATVRDTWDTLRGRYPTTFRRTPQEEAAWHWQEILANRGPRETLGHLDALIPAQPANWKLYERRGSVHSQLGQRDRAAADYLRAIELGVDDLQVGFMLYGVCAGLWFTGQLREAEQACRGAVSFFEKELSDLPANSPELATVRQPLAWSNFFLALVLTASGRTVEAIQAYRRSIELEPAVPQSRVGLARLLTTCQDPKLRDPTQALALARTAVGEMKQEVQSWSTLGMAFYRTGDWKAAIDALEHAVQLRKEGDAIDWCFLAMAHWQRGEKEKARQWYDRAVGWMEGTERFLWHRGPIGGVLAAAPAGPLSLLPALHLKAQEPGGRKVYEEELRVIRAEAAALLGLPVEGKPSPKDPE